MKKLNTLSLLIIISLSGILHAQTDFDIVKQRVVSELIKTPVDDNQVDDLIRTLKEDGTWPGINYEDVSRTAFQHSRHLSNMVAMSRAFSQKNSRFYQNEQVKQLVNRSLRHWCDKDYICENWWHNQIGTPWALVTVLLVMDEHIDQELVEKTVPILGRAHLGVSGARPGGDRIKVGGIEAKKVLVTGDKAQFAKIMKVINDEIHFRTGVRGMQHDYSFHHRVDRVNTTYSYGRGYADVFAEWAAYVAGTKYAFEEEKLEQLINYYLDGICKQFVYGMYIDKGVLNRGISRKETFAPHSPATPEWLLTTTDYRKAELEEIISLRKGETKPTASFSKFFWQTEHFAFQRPHFYTSVRMFSVRNRNMEYPHNSEGLYNHHRGDGTNYLSMTGEEYVNIWPAYDWQKISGATILQKPQLEPGEDIQKDGLTDFVGAVTDGRYGAVAFDFISPHDFTQARKSWFFFDEEYVCLGAGITSTSRYPVATTLDQSHLQGDVIAGSKGKAHILPAGKHEINDVNWIHHNGVGYLFPEPTSIHLSNTTQTGSWYDINRQWHSSKDPVSLEVFKLWIDHGARPQGRRGGLNHASMIAKDVTYQYIVVPGVYQEEMNESRDIEILANNRLLQAVKHKGLGICQIVFYEAGEVAISDDQVVSLDSPGAIMLKMKDKTVIGITVADPSRKLSRLHMKISGKMAVKAMDNCTIDFDKKTSMSEVRVELPRGVYAGQSVGVGL